MPLLSEPEITALRALAAEPVHRVPLDIGASSIACASLEHLGLAESMWLGLYETRRPAWSGRRQRAGARVLYRITAKGRERLRRIEAGRLRVVS